MSEMNGFEETHKEVSRGWYFPASLIHLWETGIINAEQMMLLGKINALQTKERGCWASNAWLGKWSNKHPRHVSRSVSYLQKLGLVKIKLIPKANNSTERQIRVTFQPDEIGDIGNERGRHQKVKGMHQKVNRGIHQKVPQLRNTSYSQSKKVKHSPACAGENVIFKSSKETPKFIVGASNHLENYIREIHKMDTRIQPNHWHREFSLLLKELRGDKKRLIKVLKEYTSKEGQYKPTAWSAQAFRKKWKNIEAWVNKNEGEEPLPKIIKECVGTVYH